MATRYAKIKTESLIFKKSNINDENAMFVRENDDTLVFRQYSQVHPVLASISSYFIKRAQAGESLDVNTPVIRGEDGKIYRATAQDEARGTVIGITREYIAYDQFGNILLLGYNLEGILNGANIIPGQDVFLSGQGGLTSVATSGNAVIRIGISDCATNETTEFAKDLIILPAYISRV